MVISETPIESHAVHRDRLIDHARRMLRDGDRLQACEKIWGAAAHGLKVVADRRDWPYTLHSDGRVIASYLGKLSGSKDLPRLFSHLEGLHRSFYADSFSLQEIEERLPDADEFPAAHRGRRPQRSGGRAVAGRSAVHSPPCGASAGLGGGGAGRDRVDPSSRSGNGRVPPLRGQGAAHGNIGDGLAPVY